MTKFSEVPQFILNNFFSLLDVGESRNYGILGDVVVGNELSEIDIIIKKESGFEKMTISQIENINENSINILPENLITPCEIENGDEIYFAKNDVFYTYIKRNTQYTDYVNYNKRLLYIGEIYNSDKFYTIRYNSLYDFVKNALPPYIINYNPKLEEYIYTIFNKDYSIVYNKQKEINSLIDPSEIDKEFLYNYAYNFGLDISEDFIKLHSEKLRQFLDNIVSFLKLKGTYTSININKQIIFFNSINELNIYDKWHDRSVSGDPSDYFEEVNIKDYYTDSKYKRYWNGVNILDESSIIMSSQKGKVWNVFHKLNTSNIIPLCLNKNGYVIEPDEIEIHNDNLIKVYFSDIVEGHLFCVKSDIYEEFSSGPIHLFDYNNVYIPVSSFSRDNFKITLDQISLEDEDTLRLEANIDSMTTFATTANDILYQNDESQTWEFDLEHSGIIPNVWVNTESNVWKITHNLETNDLIVQCYDCNHELILPQKVEFFDDYIECTFANIQKGYALLAEGNIEEFETPSLLWNFINSDIKLEQIYSDNILVLPETLTNDSSTFNENTSGNMVWSDYDYIEEINYPSSTWEINHNLDSKYNLIGTFIHNESTTWEIKHNLNSKNYLFEAYNLNDEKIFPNSVNIQNNRVYLYFDVPVSGYVNISFDNRNTFSKGISGNWNTSDDITTNIPHFLSFNKMFLNNEEWFPNIVTSSFNNFDMMVSIPASGDVYISDPDYVHVQEDYSNEWYLTHPFDTKYVISEYYTNIFRNYGDTWRFYHGLGDVICSVYDKYTKEQLLPWQNTLTNNNEECKIIYSENSSNIRGNIVVTTGDKSSYYYGTTWNEIVSNANDKVICFYNSDNEYIVPDETTVTSTTLNATFTEPISGYYVSKDVDYSETITSTTEVLITHNLNSKVLVSCVKSNNKVIVPSLIKHYDDNNVKLYFDVAVTGQVNICKGDEYLFDFDDSTWEIFLENQNGNLMFQPYRFNVAGTLTFSDTISDGNVSILDADYKFDFSSVTSFHIPGTNFNSKKLIIHVYNEHNYEITPSSITVDQSPPEDINSADVDITFDDPTSGYVLIKEGWLRSFTNASSATLNHGKNTTNILSSVYDDTGLKFDPINTEILTENTVRYTFSTLITGYAIIKECSEGFEFTGDSYDLYSHDYINPIIQCWDSNELISPEEVEIVLENKYSVIYPDEMNIHWFSFGIDKTTIDFNTSIEEGYAVFLSGEKLLQQLTDYTWTLNHSYGSNILLTEFYTPFGEKILPESVVISDTTITATFNTRQYGYCVVKECDYNYNVDVGSVSIDVTHNLDNKNILIQCIDTSNNKVIPYYTNLIDKNSCHVEFSDTFTGNILISEGETPIRKIDPSNVINYKSFTKATFDEEIEGYGIIKLANKYMSISSDIELEKTVKNIDENNSLVEFTNPKSGYCLIKKSDFIGMNLRVESPKDILLKDDKIKVEFNEPKSGLIVYKELGDFSSGKILSPHINIEMDVNHQPEEDNAILPELQTKYLINRWEEDKPVSRFYDYTVYFTPTFNLYEIGSYPLYPTTYNANCWSSLYNHIYQKTDDTYLHYQKIDTSIWTFTHDLTDTSIIHVYNKLFERIYPKSIYQKNGYVEIEFDVDISGYAMCMKPDNIYEKTILSESSDKSISISSNDVLLDGEIYDYGDNTFIFDRETVTITPETSGSIIDYYQLNNKNQFPIVEYNGDLSEVTLTFGFEIKGEFLIKNDTTYVEQTIPAKTWIINHYSENKGLFITILNDDNEVIIPNKILLESENRTIIYFDNDQSGKILFKVFGNLETLESLSERLENGIYKLGIGTSGVDYDAQTNNDVESPVLTSTNSSITTSDIIESISYFDSTNEYNITEFGIIDSFTNKILCYSYFNKIYKYNKVNLKINAIFRS